MMHLHPTGTKSAQSRLKPRAIAAPNGRRFGDRLAVGKDEPSGPIRGLASPLGFAWVANPETFSLEW